MWNSIATVLYYVLVALYSCFAADRKKKEKKKNSEHGSPKGTEYTVHGHR